MSMLEFEWIDGGVGDYWMRVGLNLNAIHIYQTPWTGSVWWVDAELFNIEKGSTYPTLAQAKEIAERHVEDWVARSVYTSPVAVEDEQLIFIDVGC
jgi:hypothetical protein